MNEWMDKLIEWIVDDASVGVSTPWKENIIYIFYDSVSSVL